jgi:hypothetical protein
MFGMCWSFYEQSSNLMSEIWMSAEMCSSTSASSSFCSFGALYYGLVKKKTIGELW